MSKSKVELLKFSNEGNAPDVDIQDLLIAPARRAAYHGHTLWLFTASDLKTIVLPSTIFGITNALAAPVYGIFPTHPYKDLMWRVPLVLFWVWMNLLPFAINNQRTPLAIAEDSVNKPWRPLPRGRISPGHAMKTMFCFYAAVPLVSIAVEGGLRQGIGLIFLGTWYNNFGGADYHPILRNAINALGYFCFTSGAMEVALATPLLLSTSDPSSRLLQWFTILTGIILTTVHAQDMYDQQGDAVRNRRTIPLVVGDGLARWMIAISMLVWGVLCPTFWKTGFLVWNMSLGLAMLVGIRTLVHRSVSSDKRTFLIWNIWVTTLYILPLLSQLSR